MITREKHDSKVWLYWVKIDEFTSAESWTILIQKMGLALGWVYCEIPSCDVAGVNGLVYVHWFLTTRETGAF